MYEIAVGAYTDVGDTRQINQDGILYKTAVICGRPVGLFVVADGCGGLSFGDEISKLAVTHFSRFWDTELVAALEEDVISAQRIDDLLEKEIFDINEAALEFGRQVGKQVGTTLSLLLTVGERYYIKNVGDSRVYVVRKKELRQLTEDQSLMADMLRNGELTPEEAKSFKKKNVLSMCIGMFDELRTYSMTGEIKGNDMFILCSDGLYNYIPENEFTADSIDGNDTDLASAAERMRGKIPPGCAKDNVSVILVRFKENGNGKGRSKKEIRNLLIVLAVILVVAIAVIVLKPLIIQYTMDLLYGGYRSPPPMGPE
jgi:protein phosphatase